MVESLRTDPALDLACETLYRYLAAAVSDPGLPGGALLVDPASQELALQAAELLRGEFAGVAMPLGFGELPAEDLSLPGKVALLVGSTAALREEFVRVFGLSMCRECPPYETEYHKAEEVFFRSQQMADIAGFYQAFGLTPGGMSRERPDHLSLELEYVAHLLLKQRLAMAAGDSVSAERAAVCRQAREDFVRDHLAWWVPSFALALRSKAETGFYAAIGRVLSALMPVERYRLGITAPKMPLEASYDELPDECSGCLVSLDA